MLLVGSNGPLTANPFVQAQLGYDPFCNRNVAVKPSLMNYRIRPWLCENASDYLIRAV
jgi:hypothetical protein